MNIKNILTVAMLSTIFISSLQLSAMEGSSTADSPTIDTPVVDSAEKKSTNEQINDRIVKRSMYTTGGIAATLIGLPLLFTCRKFIAKAAKKTIKWGGLFAGIAGTIYFGVRKFFKPKPATKSWWQQIKEDTTSLFGRGATLFKGLFHFCR